MFLLSRLIHFTHNMKVRYLIPAASLILMTAACKQSHPSDSSNPSPQGIEIESFPINTTLLTSSETYFGVPDSVIGDTYLTLTASILWPEVISDKDIKPLQDSIMHVAFPGNADGNPRSAIREFVTDVAAYQLGNMEKCDKVKKVSENVRSYSSEVSGRLVEVNRQSCTYLLSFSEYMGGAHPNHASVVMSYDFATGKCVDYDYLFKPGVDAELQTLIMESLAANMAVSIKDLDSELLVKPLPVSKDVYVLNGMLVFHYNPYDILPYSYGTIDVDVAPYQVKDYLTPEAYEMLVDN